MANVIDKGRIVAAVEYYQAKENGQPLWNQDNTPKMKPKWMAIGECTKWMGDNGEFVTRKIYLDVRNPGHYETREYWDSENQNNDQAPQQTPQMAPQQAPQQYTGQPNQPYNNHRG